MSKCELNEERIAELREAFAMYDKNGDGVISVGELGTVLCALGQNPTRKQLEEFIKEVDVISKNGVIDFEEFKAMVAKRGLKSKSEEEEELRQAFRIIDRDGNEYIDTKELRELMKNLGEDKLTEEEIREMMAVADTNKDGKINYNGQYPHPPKYPPHQLFLSKPHLGYYNL